MASGEKVDQILNIHDVVMQCIMHHLLFNKLEHIIILFYVLML